MGRRGRGRGVCGQRCGRKREVLVCWVHHLSFLFRPASFLFWGAGSPSCSCSSVGIAFAGLCERGDAGEAGRRRITSYVW